MRSIYIFWEGWLFVGVRWGREGVSTACFGVYEEAINELSFCLAGARIKMAAFSNVVYFYNKKTIRASTDSPVFVLQMDLETQTQTTRVES